ncbi:hypothetical protein SERLA73DRAFT_17988, partial [Serpula lacrymans var. lacrymans S7.3]
EEIPWPILKHPNSITPHNVQWYPVEAFFTHTSTLQLMSNSFTKMVRDMWLKYHPDRWIAR